LARFDLADKLFDRVDRLSGGERQRVGLARLVASNAQLLLVDEPLSALDPERARQAVQSLTAVARARGATLVSTLHHVEMALQHFPRIVGMRGGALAFDLSADQVSPALLQDLYASHLDELTGPAPVVDLAVPGEPVTAMQCR
jgi:phosphonate transport system ATP-binding protein